MIVGQVALAMVLLVAGGLLARSVLQQRALDLRFDMERTLVVPLSLQRAGIGGEQITTTARAICEAAAALPGVEAASDSNIRPFSGSSTVMQFAVEGRAAEGPEAPASQPGLLAMVTLGLLAASVAAALGPARSAARLETSATLRAE